MDFFDKVREAVVLDLCDPRVQAAAERLTLQRHLSALTKFAHVESRVCGRKQQGKAVLYPSENPCVKKPVPISVAVGLSGSGLGRMRSTNA